MQLGTFKAWITVDNVELPEHSVQLSADGKQITCWIASEVGKNFTVSWTDSVRSYSSSGKLYIDGIECGLGKHIFGRHHPSGRKAVTLKRNSYRTSSTTERPFLFSNLELTDDDAYLHNAASTELGDIRLEITEIRFTGVTKQAIYQPLPEPEKIHERSKKAMGHRFKLGDEKSCALNNSYLKVKRIRSIGSFVFKYRPLAHLQANGLVPVEKKRKHAAIHGVVLDLTLDNDDDDVVEARRIQALEKELTSLKQRQGRRSKKVKVEVKAEPSSLNSSGPRQLGDIIDLT